MEIQFTETMTEELWSLMKSMSHQELMLLCKSIDKAWSERLQAHILMSKAASEAELEDLKKQFEKISGNLETKLTASQNALKS